MPYLTEPSEIKAIIASYTEQEILWIDTEVADYKKRQKRVSLVQILDDSDDIRGDRVAILDVLDRPELVQCFIDQIMVNPKIQKVFHNANFDLKFLGGNQAQNATCTWEMAKQIPYHLLPLPNLQLKTLAATLCQFTVGDSEQSSDWGQRPLTDNQLQYAKMDAVYLAQIYQKLRLIITENSPNPAQENVSVLTERYLQLSQQFKLIESEIECLQSRLKQAMQVQNIQETAYLKLASYQRSSKKVAFNQLADLARSQGVTLDFPVALTQPLQKQLGNLVQQLPVEEEITTSWRLTVKQAEEGAEF